MVTMEICGCHVTYNSSHILEKPDRLLDNHVVTVVYRALHVIILLELRLIEEM